MSSFRIASLKSIDVQNTCSKSASIRSILRFFNKKISGAFGTTLEVVRDRSIQYMPDPLKITCNFFFLSNMCKNALGDLKAFLDILKVLSNKFRINEMY